MVQVHERGATPPWTVGRIVNMLVGAPHGGVAASCAVSIGTSTIWAVAVPVCATPSVTEIVTVYVVPVAPEVKPAAVLQELGPEGGVKVPPAGETLQVHV